MTALPSEKPRITVRPSEEQKSAWESAAGREGLSLNAWLTAAADAAAGSPAPRPRPVVHAPPVEQDDADERRHAALAAAAEAVRQDRPSVLGAKVDARLAGVSNVEKAVPRGGACPAHHVKGVRCKLCAAVG